MQLFIEINWCVDSIMKLPLSSHCVSFNWLQITGLISNLNCIVREVIKLTNRYTENSVEARLNKVYVAFVTNILFSIKLEKIFNLRFEYYKETSWDIIISERFFFSLSCDSNP